jgi:hypothetical protein
MMYKVTARDDWDINLANKFGASGSIHNLSDSEVIDAIIVFGRAEIRVETNSELRSIEFHNNYD